MNSSLFTLNPYARVREEHFRTLRQRPRIRQIHTRACARSISRFYVFKRLHNKSIRARARGAFGRVWIYRVGRVDYPCVSGALRDVYNGVETPPFKPYLYTRVRGEKLVRYIIGGFDSKYLYTRVRGEKRCTAHFDSFHAGYPYAYE